MTAEEGALNLIISMNTNFPYGKSWEIAKRCAVVCVDEIYKLPLKIGMYLDEFADKESYYSFWEDVKTAINKIY